MKNKDLKSKTESSESKEKNKKSKTNATCNATHFVDESYRMDDNSDFSTIAIAENKCMSEPLVPGVGVDESDVEDDK